MNVPRERGAPDASASGSGAAHEAAVDIVAQARAGSLDAWTRLYHESFDAIYRHLGYLTGDPSLAEDLTQEVFARAYVSLDRFDGRSTIVTWLYGIARKVLYKHWRRLGRRRRTPPPGIADPIGRGGIDDADPERLFVQQRRAAALQAAMETLPPHYREAFVLVALRELPTAEVAALLGISRSNVSVRVHRARARIHRELARAGWLEAPAEEDA